MARGAKTTSFRTRLRRGDGSLVPAGINLQPVRDLG
jgi:hypothetical protein